ncbi:MAG: sugar phosphate isomerase/epimerase [Acutalibacteraceae bacterium]|nr:sugar phosphate isomerase/epimerase [Acutalibacteraceae bacterium]
MNLGISTASFYPLETELALEELGKAGVKNTEIFFNAESELKDSFIEILLCLKEKYNINITAVHPAMSLAESYMLFSAYDRRYYEGLKQYRRYSEVAKALGAKYLIMHGGKPNGVLNDEEYCQRYMALNYETGQNGVTVLQENVVNYRSGDIEFMRSMKNILGDDAKFCLDIKQCVRCGYLPMDLIEEFYDNIRHFHISDHSVAGDCLLPLKGKFDFKGLFDFLNQKGYEGALMTEVYRYAYKEYDEIFESFRKLRELSL